MAALIPVDKFLELPCAYHDLTLYVDLELPLISFQAINTHTAHSPHFRFMRSTVLLQPFSLGSSFYVMYVYIFRIYRRTTLLPAQET